MKKLFTIMSLAFVGLTFAQEEESKFNVTGSVDAYFRANLTSSNDAYNGGAQSNSALGAGDLSLFNNDSGFSAGLVNVMFSYEGEDVGFIADMAYGPRMDAYNNGEVINEAYMYWNASDKVMLMMGRFNSWMGYETLSAANNFHYSMSHTFTYTPRNFNGLVAQFDLGSDFTAGVGVMNPVEVTTGNDTGDFSVGAGVTYKSTTGLSYLASQSASYIDFKTAFDVTETFDVKLNAQVADFGYADRETGQQWTNEQVALVGLGIEGFTSITAYPQLKTSDTFSWGMRLEYIMFDDANDTSVFTPTLTGRYSVGDLTIIPELRMDSASEDLFKDADGVATGGLTAFNLAAVYTF
jgi:hypothetical protein